MARTVVEKNIWFDDERNLYYVNLDYGKDKRGKAGDPVFTTRLL